MPPKDAQNYSSCQSGLAILGCQAAMHEMSHSGSLDMGNATMSWDVCMVVGNLKIVHHVTSKSTAMSVM